MPAELVLVVTLDFIPAQAVIRGERARQASVHGNLQTRQRKAADYLQLVSEARLPATVELIRKCFGELL